MGVTETKEAILKMEIGAIIASLFRDKNQRGATLYPNKHGFHVETHV